MHACTTNASPIDSAYQHAVAIATGADGGTNASHEAIQVVH